jgi:hypothetical protein
MSKRKATEPAPSVTINQFFMKVQGPTQAVADPNAWLEKEVPGSRPTTRLMNGELRAMCDHMACKLPLSLPHFKPKKNPRDEADFDAAYVKYEAARLARNVEEMDEAREVLEARKVAKCTHHRAQMAKSEAEGPNNQVAKCKAAWNELQATTFSKCRNCDGTRAVEANHVDPEGLVDPKNKKVEAVSKVYYWAFHGGVPALRNEAQKCEPLCRMCHTIEETSYAGNRTHHPDTYPVVRFKDDKQAYNKRCQAQIRYPKQQYVDDVKRFLGGCAHLGCPGNEGPPDWVNQHPQCGDLDHIDEALKGRAISLIVNSLKKVPDAAWKAEIDTELRKCRLLCRNCHHLRSNKGLSIETIPRDQYLLNIEAAIAHATANLAAYRAAMK